MNFSKVNFQDYYKAFSQKHFTICISLGTIILISRKILFGSDNWMIEHFFSKVENNNLLHVAVVVLFLYSLYRLIVNFYRELLPTINSIITGCTLCLIYIVLREDNEYYYYTFEKWGVPNVYVFDSIIFAAVISLLDYKTYNREIKLGADYNDSFIEDFSDIESDTLSRNGYAETLAKLIGKTRTERSFTIGIFAEWGLGRLIFKSTR